MASSWNGRGVSAPLHAAEDVELAADGGLAIDLDFGQRELPGLSVAGGSEDERASTGAFGQRVMRGERAVGSFAVGVVEGENKDVGQGFGGQLDGLGNVGLGGHACSLRGAGRVGKQGRGASARVTSKLRWHGSQAGGRRFLRGQADIFAGFFFGLILDRARAQSAHINTYRPDYVKEGNTHQMSQHSSASRGG